MPFIRDSAKAGELSWDSFEAPTPEISSWKPDPDSVPLAGSLPDPRFNKDPLEARQKQALRREKLRGRASDRFSATNSECSTTSSTTATVATKVVGEWPVVVPRAATPAFAIWSVLPMETPVMTEGPLAPKTGSELSLYSSLPSNLPTQPSFAAPRTPSANSFSKDAVSPDDFPTPACPLEHLMKGLIVQHPPITQPALIQDELAVTVSKSIPPHLRKHKQVSRTTSNQAFLDSEFSSEKIQTLAVDKGFKEPKKLVPESDSESTKTVKDVQHQKSLLESLIPKKPVPSHERYLQVRLINMMKDEMDMEARITRRDLCAMDDKTFKAYFNKVMCMHKLLWDSGQTRDETEGVI